MNQDQTKLAFRQRSGSRWITGFGASAASLASFALIYRLIQTDLMALLFLTVLVLIAVFGRPILLRHFKTKTRREP